MPRLVYTVELTVEDCGGELPDLAVMAARLAAAIAPSPIGIWRKHNDIGFWIDDVNVIARRGENHA